MSFRCRQVVRIFDNEATGRREYFMQFGKGRADVLATSYSRAHVEHRSSIPWGFYRKVGLPTWPQSSKYDVKNTLPKESPARGILGREGT